ncbi:ArsR/SmtB family transcription factor [Streptomyces sp. URMC 123]|uniref:ArsR/SmtB family transcription factor n=1 Tax=Streptomyces sp. URMC 123 TaxID=3423403 RepID=UPI003F1A5DEA
MLRVYFTPEDLARVRVSTAPDPLWEIANSVQMLRRRDGARYFGHWRSQVRDRLSPASRLLTPLLPPHGYSPDFLTPGDGASDSVRGTDGARPAAGTTTGDGVLAGLEQAIDAVLRTPRDRLRTDLTRLAAERGLPGWGAALARGEPEALRRLGDALRTYHAEALAPFWTRIEAEIEADRQARLRSLLDGGHEGLLSGLGPSLRWRPPVLEADYPVDRELRLEGRGLVLQPSLFCWRTPVTLADPALPGTPVLVYPIQHTPAWSLVAPTELARGEHPEALGALVGQTRAALLVESTTGRSTGDLARRLGVSGPAVSQHVAVLREAGLLITVRHGGGALHIATPEGRALLRAATGRTR